MFGLSPRWMLALLALMVMQPGAPALAQSYPSKPVTIIVPLAAGTGMDTLARLYGEQLSQALGKPVVIENKPGAGLMLGTAAVAAATPDGHTLGISTATPMAVNQVLYKKMSYDPDKDLTPVYFYVKSPFVLVVNPALPINSVPELIKYARESANPMSYSTPGAGTLAAPVDGVHGAALRPQGHARALSQLAAIHHRHRRRSRQSRLRRGRRVAAPDPRGQAARARGVVRGSAAHIARRAAVRRSRRRARFRSGVLAHPVRTGGHAERDRRPPARRDAAHHVDARHEEARLGYRASAARIRPRSTASAPTSNPSRKNGDRWSRSSASTARNNAPRTMDRPQAVPAAPPVSCK